MKNPNQHQVMTFAGLSIVGFSVGAYFILLATLFEKLPSIPWIIGILSFGVFIALFFGMIFNFQLSAILRDNPQPEDQKTIQ